MSISRNLGFWGVVMPAGEAGMLGERDRFVLCLCDNLALQFIRLIIRTRHATQNVHEEVNLNEIKRSLAILAPKCGDANVCG